MVPERAALEQLRQLLAPDFHGAPPAPGPPLRLVSPFERVGDQDRQPAQDLPPVASRMSARYSARLARLTSSSWPDRIRSDVSSRS